MLKNKNLFWYVAGFVDGEGSFNVSFKRQKSDKLELGFRWLVHLGFQVYQHEDHRDILVLLQKEVFHTGRIYRKSSPYNVLTFSIDNSISLKEKVIPFFDKYKLIVKNKDFIIFKEILNLFLTKQHLSENGIKKIIDLAFQMNANGKQRKYSKEYILETYKKQLQNKK